MKFHRQERVSKLIMEYLNELILREVEVPGALVTITDVEISKDLEHAKVLVSILPSEKSEGVLKVLEKSQNKLQFTLGRKLNIRPMPKISFEIDYGMEKAARIEKLSLEEENKK